MEEAGQWNKRYFRGARDWNCNVVRIPIHPQWWNERGEQAYLELLDRGIEWAGELGRMSWSQYKEFIEEIIHIIYAYDKTVIPLVGGFDWGYNLSYVKDYPIDAPGIAYVTHPYPQKREPPWEEKWKEDFGFVADTYPVFATEFGFMSEDGPGAHIPVIGKEKIMELNK